MVTLKEHLINYFLELHRMFISISILYYIFLWENISCSFSGSYTLDFRVDEFHLSSHLWAHGDFLETHWSTRTFCSELFVIRTDNIRQISARNNKCEIQTHWRSDDWWSNVLAAAGTARLTATRSRLQPHTQHKSVTKVWQVTRRARDTWHGDMETRGDGGQCQD